MSKDIKEKIEELKHSDFDKAFDCSIDIVDKDNEVIGYLVPIGAWILQDEKLINIFCKWRKISKSNFN